MKSLWSPLDSFPRCPHVNRAAVTHFRPDITQIHVAAMSPPRPGLGTELGQGTVCRKYCNAYNPQRITHGLWLYSP